MEDSTTRILLKNFPDPIATGVVLAAYGQVGLRVYLFPLSSFLFLLCDG